MRAFTFPRPFGSAFRSVAWLWLAATLVSQPPSAARADDYRYPKAAPVLTVTLPDDWTFNESEGAAKILMCSPPDDTNYYISVMTMPTTGGKIDLADLLTRITRAAANGARLTDISVSSATEETVGHSARVFTKVTASGKHNDEDSAYTYYAFRLAETGRYYAVGVAGLQAMIGAHKADFERVAESITAAK